MEERAAGYRNDQQLRVGIRVDSEVREVMYLRSLLYELGHQQVESMLIWKDKRAGTLIAEHESSSAGRCTASTSMSSSGSSRFRVLGFLGVVVRSL